MYQWSAWLGSVVLPTSKYHKMISATFTYQYSRLCIEQNNPCKNFGKIDPNGLYDPRRILNVLMKTAWYPLKAILIPNKNGFCVIFKILFIKTILEAFAFSINSLSLNYQVWVVTIGIHSSPWKPRIDTFYASSVPLDVCCTQFFSLIFCIY